MKRAISYAEYKRRVFNHILTEGFVAAHSAAINENAESSQVMENIQSVARDFIAEQLKLNESTILTTKDRLKNAPYFVKRLVALAESVSTEKMEALVEAGLQAPDTVELNPEEQDTFEDFINTEMPEDGVEEVVARTARALAKEDQKAKEIKEAIDLMNEKCAGSEAIQESVNNMTRKGPTSLMGAIIMTLTENVIKSEMEKFKDKKPAEIMDENSQVIKEDAMAAYTLYETMNTFGFKTMDNKQVEILAFDIYNGRVK